MRRSILQQLLVSITFPNFLDAGESGQNDAFLIIILMGEAVGSLSGLLGKTAQEWMLVCH